MKKSARIACVLGVGLVLAMSCAHLAEAVTSGGQDVADVKPVWTEEGKKAAPPSWLRYRPKTRWCWSLPVHS